MYNKFVCGLAILAHNIKIIILWTEELGCVTDCIKKIPTKLMCLTKAIG